MNDFDGKGSCSSCGTGMKKKASKWVDFVKSEAKRMGIKYNEALKNPAVSAAYKKMKGDGFHPDKLFKIDKKKGNKIGKKIGVAIIDPGSQYERSLKKLGVGDRDAATVGRVVDYGYGAATLGVAPVAKLGLDEYRSREAQSKKQNKKKGKGMEMEGSGKKSGWIDFVKSYAKKHNIPYGQALKEASKEYRKK